MKKMGNEVHVEGYLYEQALEKKVSQKGVEYIKGKISIATDEEMTNIVEVNFTYVTAIFAKSQKPNKTYELLDNIFNSGTTKTYMGGGKDNALKLRVDSSLKLNEWFDKNSGDLISQMRIEGGFVHTAATLNPDEKKRNTFKNDMLISAIFPKDADEEKNIPAHAVLKGVIFDDFTQAILPASFTLYNPMAIEYFSKLEPSSSKPVFTKIWGNITSQESKTLVETESAFGEKLIEEKFNTKKEYVITGALSDTYEWDSPDTILASDVLKAQNDREMYLAEMKKSQEEREKAKAAGSTPNMSAATSASTAAAPGAFKF